MNNLLWLIPVLPLLGFLILSLAGKSLSKRFIALIGVGTVSLSALISILIGLNFLNQPPPAGFISQTLYTWIEIGNFKPEITFLLDPLSLVFVFVITFIGALIHIYSAGFMIGDKDYSRFFASMNLFVFFNAGISSG